MRRVTLIVMTAIFLTGALGLAARAEGPIPDCLFIGSTVGTGVVPPGGESFVCETGVEDGEHTLRFGWTVGATAVATIKVVSLDEDIQFMLRCALLAGVSQCHTVSNVPAESIENPFELLGPLNAQRTAIIRLSEAAQVTFTAGPYTHTFTCVGPDQCARVVLAEGVLGLTVDEGREVQCLLLPCEPPPPCPEPTSTGEPTPTGSPVPAGEPSPSPTPTSTQTACPSPEPSPQPTGTASPSPSPTDPPPTP